MRFVLVILSGIAMVMTESCSLASKIERTTAKNLSKGPYDAIIVPGYPYRDAKYPELFITRLYYAKELYDKGYARNIIFSGAAAHTPYVEGILMKTFADSLGIPAEHTFSETEALHSNQNAHLGYKKARQLGFKKVAIATDPYQFSYMLLLRGLFAPKTRLLAFTPDRMGFYIRPLPVVDTTTAYIKDFVNRID